jgi:NADH:ubiquinone oxidoreductase subunit 4 (subunit M)
MFTPAEAKSNYHISVSSHIVLAIIVAGIIFLGILPSFLTELISAFSSLN